MNLNEWNAPQELCTRQGLATTSAVERNVLLALQSPLDIPFGFAVPGDDQAMWASIANELGEICLIGHLLRGATHDLGRTSVPKCR